MMGRFYRADRTDLSSFPIPSESPDGPVIATLTLFPRQLPLDTAGRTPGVRAGVEPLANTGDPYDHCDDSLAIAPELPLCLARGAASRIVTTPRPLLGAALGEDLRTAEGRGIGWDSTRGPGMLACTPGCTAD